MAQMQYLRVVRKKIGLSRLGIRVWKEVGDDNCFGWAAALAYSWLFAIFPFFIFLITLTPYIPQSAKRGFERQLHSAIDYALPTDAARTVWGTIEPQLKDVLDKPRKGLLSIGLVITLWAASGGMAMTMQALDRAHDVKVARSFFRHRLVAIMLTAIVASLILAVVVLLPVGSLVIGFIQRYGDKLFGKSIPIVWLIFIEVFRYCMAIALMLMTVASMYHFGTYLKRRFVMVTPGAVFVMLVWVILGFAFRLYVNNFTSYSKTYGAVGGVVILLLFFYLDALVLLIGAEINSEIDAVVLDTPDEPILPKPTGDEPEVRPV
jgi:membrane protein